MASSIRASRPVRSTLGRETATTPQPLDFAALTG
jgi:hypothetical protein